MGDPLVFVSPEEGGTINGRAYNERDTGEHCGRLES